LTKHAFRQKFDFSMPTICSKTPPVIDLAAGDTTVGLARPSSNARRAAGPRAKANGVKFGRKPILTAHQKKEALKRLDAGETQRSVARSYNVSQSTISHLTA
jgi:predicted nucleic acid-binding Zn ribbon protein